MTDTIRLDMVIGVWRQLKEAERLKCCEATINLCRYRLDEIIQSVIDDTEGGR
jgi:hypothetical protein